LLLLLVLQGIAASSSSLAITAMLGFADSTAFIMSFCMVSCDTETHSQHDAVTIKTISSIRVCQMCSPTLLAASCLP
jgi:hypothetical protein